MGSSLWWYGNILSTVLFSEMWNLKHWILLCFVAGYALHMPKHSLSSVAAVPWQMLPRQYKNNTYSVSIYCCCIMNYFRVIFLFLDKYWNTKLQILMVLTKAPFFTLVLMKMYIEYIKYLSCVTNHHTTNKCTNCMSFILNHFFKTLSMLLHVSIAYRLIIIREHI